MKHAGDKTLCCKLGKTAVINPTDMPHAYQDRFQS